MLQQIIIAATGGKLYRYNFKSDLLSTIFKDERNEFLMGLERRGKFLYVGAKSRIFKIKMNDKLDISETFTNPGGKVAFHQMTINGKYLYITVTKYNEIWKFDLNLNLCKKFKIEPPNTSLPVKYGKNYNHLNNIFYHNNNFHICLNWLTQQQYGPSGVAILNDEMEEIDRFGYGWETHNYMILENRKYALCSSSKGIKNIHHSHKGGLMVDGELVFEFDPDLFFCYGFSIDKNFIYIIGGGVTERDNRDFVNGAIFVLDRKFNHISTHEFANSGAFLGCLLPHEDFTKGNS